MTEPSIASPKSKGPDSLGFYKWEIVSADDPSKTSTFYTRDAEAPGISIMLLEGEVNRLTFQRNAAIAGGLAALVGIGLLLGLRRKRGRE